MRLSRYFCIALLTPSHVLNASLHPITATQPTTTVNTPGAQAAMLSNIAGQAVMFASLHFMRQAGLH